MEEKSFEEQVKEDLYHINMSLIEIESSIAKVLGFEWQKFF